MDCNSLKFARNSDITSGTGHVNGTYYNVKLFNNNAVPLLQYGMEQQLI